MTGKNKVGLAVEFYIYLNISFTYYCIFRDYDSLSKENVFENNNLVSIIKMVI